MFQMNYEPIQLSKEKDSLIKYKNIKEVFPSEVESLQEKYILHKLPPIRIVRRSIPNSKKLKMRLIAHGHKYFSKFIASGEETEDVLRKIMKSTTLKYISYLEFDPYFCEVSCIRSLINISKKLRGTKNMNLIIRRVDIENEIRQLYPVLYKVQRLEKIRLEFPKTQNVNEEGYLSLARAIGKCYSLKYAAHQFVDLREYNFKSGWMFLIAQRRLIHLEESSLYISSSNSSMKNEFNPTLSLPHFRNKKVKRKHMCIAVTNEWSFMEGSGQDSSNEQQLKLFSNYSNIEFLSAKAIRHPIESDMAFESFPMLAKIGRLHCMELEFLKYKKFN